MALIDGNYVLAKTEKIPYEIEVTENPVESGIALTDHTERKSLELSLECLVVDQDNGIKAKDTLEKLQKIQEDAKIVKFVGRNIFNGIITTIEKTDSHEVANGFSCTITMKEIRIAKSPFRPDLLQAAINAGLQQAANQNNGAVYHIVVKGECLIKIAKKYGTTLNWIIQHNKIPSGNPNLIYPGEKYLVKEGSTKAATVTQSLRWLTVAEELKKRASGTKSSSSSSSSKSSSSSSSSSSKSNSVSIEEYRKSMIKMLEGYYYKFKNSEGYDVDKLTTIYMDYYKKMNKSTDTSQIKNYLNLAMTGFNSCKNSSGGGGGIR